MSKGFKNLMAVIALFFMLIVTLAAQSLEYKLACLNKGYRVSESDITITRFKSLLKQLSYTFIEDKKDIADYSVKALQILKEKYGVEQNLLQFMEGMNKLFSRKIENQKYLEYSTMYLTLRGKGQSHVEAIEGIKALLQSLGIY